MEKEYFNFFLRIDEKEYLTSFQKGHMYMKPARSFREYTGNVPGVGDKNEGLKRIITDKKVTITITDDKGISITPQICGPIKFYTDGYYPILCLYHLKIKCHKMDEKYVVELPKDYLKNLSENRKDPGVLILLADAFLNKIRHYIRSNIEKFNLMNLLKMLHGEHIFVKIQNGHIKTNGDYCLEIRKKLNS